MSTGEQQEIENQALDFLEHWLTNSEADILSQSSEEAPRNFDPSLLAIERLASQYQELFRRHTQVK